MSLFQRNSRRRLDDKCEFQQAELVRRDAINPFTRPLPPQPTIFLFSLFPPSPVFVSSHLLISRSAPQLSTFKCSRPAPANPWLPSTFKITSVTHRTCSVFFLRSPGSGGGTHLSVKYFIKGHVIPLPTQLHEASSCEVPVDGPVIG